ncbi:MAG: outer membrane protein assembly factor BamB, partial [Kiritimatiellia bacterium]
MRLIKSAFLMSLLAGAVQGADEFYMYRGGPSLTGIAQGTLPEKLDLLWTFKTEYEVKSSISVVGDRAVFGSGDEKVYCLDKESGAKLWEFKTEGEVESSPIIRDGVVYVGSGDGFLYALKLATGEKIWAYETQDRILGAANHFTGKDGKLRIIVGSYDFF